jgi:hypothetical protein
MAKLTRSLEELRRQYPWPAQRPDVEPYLREDGLPRGWCAHQNVAMFGRFLGPETSVVLELGSMFGLSATRLLQAAPNATVICIDHFKGSEEHQGREGWERLLSEMREILQVHLWEQRHRVIVMPRSTSDGMLQVVQAGVRPDLVYVDASHKEPAVYRDVRDAMRYFPDAVVCGDDWDREEVRQGVFRAVDQRRVRTDLYCWWLEAAT